MDMATKKKQLGRAVERERSKQKLTQRQLAYMADTTQTEISKIENATSDAKCLADQDQRGTWHRGARVLLVLALAP